jgi:hypothetical protein
VKISKEEFVSLLERLVESVRGGDSLEGRLQYREVGDGQFEVGCCYRVGNSEGQGGVVPLAPKLAPTPGERKLVEKLAMLRTRVESGDKKAGKEWRTALAKIAFLRNRARGGDAGPPWRHLPTCRYD